MSRVSRIAIVGIFIATLLMGTAALADQTLLLRYPDIHNGMVAFSYGGDLWTVSEGGGTARRVTGHTKGMEIHPKFSPDGQWIAFTGDYDVNQNVYLVPAMGGEPKCLTFHPARDRVIDWTPDGKVLFSTRRGQPLEWLRRLYLVSTEGGLETPLPMPAGAAASYSPDGSKIAFNRIDRDYRSWKRYKGGTAQDIWIYDFSANKTTQATKWAGTDSFPMWQGDNIYFLSDRKYTANIFVTNQTTGKTRQLTFHDEYDVKWPSMGPGRVVYENGGALHVLDMATEKTKRISISVPSDRIATRPRWEGVGDQLAWGDISPSGKRVVFEARGDIFTVPEKKGPTRNLTASSGTRERMPEWSPDGKWIAYFSDESGEMEIYVQTQDGSGEKRRVTHDGSVYRFRLKWSPDSEKLLFADKNQILYYVDADGGKPQMIAKSESMEIKRYEWSPDSKWVVYEKTQKNRLASIFLYSVRKEKSYRVTEDMTDDGFPVFDRDGKHLYFLSNRDIQPYLDMYDANYILQNITKIYAVTLSNDELSPFAPQSDEENDPKEKKDDEDSDKDDKKAEKVDIDIAGIKGRVVAFPIPAGNYRELAAGDGCVFYISQPSQPLSGTWDKDPEDFKLLRFDFKEREVKTVVSPVSWYSLSADGKKILYGHDGEAGIIKSDVKGKKKGEGSLDLSDMRMLLDPVAEWRQMFNEAWRLQRDFFYDPDMHGVDWAAMKEKYGTLLGHASTRDDLNYLLGEMIGELNCSHTYVWGGDRNRGRNISVGLLGADFALDEESGRYYLKSILPPDRWDLDNDSPLMQPGMNVEQGDYIMAIGGRDLAAPDNPYKLLQDTVGKQTLLTVAKSAGGRKSRDITIVPIGSERSLRYRYWAENNRRKVDEATGGRIGYMHLPDMSSQGLKEFSKAFNAQIDKQGMVVDVRYNGGGFVSEMILEKLRRELAGMFTARNAGDESYPWMLVHGPMVCIINEHAGSDGDIFPYFFRHYKLGKVIGRRTWGGVVGIRMDKRLVDGGGFTMPEYGTYGIKRTWIMEGYGVDPDIKVELLPEDFIDGRDPQLDKAIGIALDELEKADWIKPPRPDKYSEPNKK
jgi:tricorn protease